MERQKQNYRPLFFTLILALLAAGAVIFLNLGDAQRTLPKIKVSYFKNNLEIASAVEQRLHLEIGQKKYFWIGYEPEKENQLELVSVLRTELEKQIGAFDIVIIDKELSAKIAGTTHEIPLKVNFAEAAELIKANVDKKILVITAAIYSTSFIKENPRGNIFELTGLRPMTFSIGHFPATAEEEKFNLFKCDTEDKTGTSPWGCAVLNKARSVRRRIDQDKLKESPQLRLGLMDLTGETDYMILTGK